MSRTQCQFELDDKTGTIFIFDGSSSGTTRLHSGEDLEPLQQFCGGRHNCAELKHGINYRLSLGNEENAQEYEIIWHKSNDELGKILWHYRPDKETMERNDRTRNSNDPTNEVRLVAVRQVTQILPFKGGGQIESLQKELSKFLPLDHINVRLNFGDLTISADESHIGVIQEWIPGSFSLRNWNTMSPDCPLVKTSLMYQLLRGLDYLHEEKIIHGQVCPDNILCIPHAVGTLFKLTGLSPVPPSQRCYRAPEGHVTSKTDIQGLFGVFVEGFGLIPPVCSEHETLQAFQILAAHTSIGVLKRMASEVPAYRPEAAEVMKEVFDKPAQDSSGQLVLFDNLDANHFGFPKRVD